MNQFDPTLTDLEISQLYRDSWTAGNGFVNFDSFFLVANERTLFLKTIRIMGFNSIPILTHLEEFNGEDRYHNKLEFVYKAWKQNQAMFAAVKEQMIESGNELFLKKYTQFEELIKQKE